MKQSISLAALCLTAVVLIFLVYQGFIIPYAEQSIAVAQQAEEGAPRNLLVILKDVEQQICVMLSAIAIILMLNKLLDLRRSSHLHRHDFFRKENGEQRSHAELIAELDGLDNIWRETPMADCLHAAVTRFQATRNVHDTSEAIASTADTWAEKLDGGNSYIRYLIWAIPSIGFIGTVRGIGQALAQANEALNGDISNMTNSLGIAFNSTLVALFLSILLMFLLHIIQSMQDEAVVEAKRQCHRIVIDRISAAD